MKLSVANDAFVIPKSRRSNLAGRNPSLSSFSFSSITLLYSTCSPLMNGESPISKISTLRNICRVITSICLSFILTPWSRYTS